VMASPKATLDCVDAFSRTDFRRDLASFTMPTLIVHGSADATIPVATSGRAATRGIPHATFLEYEGEPHGLHATAPDRLNHDLL
jgi:non-heme chloroperoxidase